MRRLLILAMAVWSAIGFAAPAPHEGGHPTRPHHKVARVFERGLASWYAEPYHGRKAASGEIYDKHEMTAAHPTLPFNTLVRVRRVDSGDSVVVRINDRGPFVASRIIDLSYAAAVALGMADEGVAPVALEIVGHAAPL